MLNLLIIYTPYKHPPILFYTSQNLFQKVNVSFPVEFLILCPINMNLLKDYYPNSVIYHQVFRMSSYLRRLQFLWILTKPILPKFCGILIIPIILDLFYWGWDYLQCFYYFFMINGWIKIIKMHDSLTPIPVSFAIKISLFTRT